MNRSKVLFRLEVKSNFASKIEQDLKAMRGIFNSLQAAQSELEAQVRDSVPKLEVAGITSELIGVQEALRDAESKQKDMEKTIAIKGKENEELLESVESLQFQVQTYATQLEQVNLELQSKRNTLKSTEETLLTLREKLEDSETRNLSLSSSLQTAADRSSHLEIEVQKLSKQLQLLINEYKRLEQTVEENTRYCQEAEKELKRRDRVIDHLKHQAEEASADYKFRISQLSAESDQLRRQRLMRSPRVDDSELSLSRRSRG